MVFVPSSNGMLATLHDCVPVALPEDPVEFDQVTDVTLAEAVPLNAIVVADVETMLMDGEVMVREGGPATGADGGHGGAG